MCPLYSSRELLQESDIILGIQAQVIDAVFELANPFNPHPEGKAGILVGVDAEVFQHFRMYHTAAEDLYPTGMFAYAAAAAAADPAVDIHLGAGFREGEIGGAETDFDILPEHLLYKEIERLFQIGEADILIHIQSFRLVKKTMRPCADGLIAVYATGTDDPDRRLLPLHRPCLYIAGMCTQQPIGLLVDIESVLHIPGRMVLRHVEGGKIMPVVFDLGAFRHGKTQSSENMDDLVAYHRDRMVGAQG